MVQKRKYDTHGKRPPLRGISSIISLLNGLSSKKDIDYVSMRHNLNHGKYSDELQAFSKQVKGPDSRSYETLWLESPYGAYALIKTALPVDQRWFYQRLYKKPQIELKEAYALLFSPYTEFLEQALMRDEINSGSPKEQDIEAFIEVRAAYLEDDLKYDNPLDTGEKMLDLSWVENIVNEHVVSNEERLRTHGKLLRTSENLYRSGSTVLWFERNPKRKDKFDCYYYANPAQGEDMLYIEPEMLENPLYRFFARLGAKKINHRLPQSKANLPWYKKVWRNVVKEKYDQHLIDSDSRHEFARQAFVDISAKIMRHSDPYDMYQTVGLRQKILHTTKREGSRMVQKMFHDGSKIDTKSLGITIVGTVAMYAFFLLYKLAAAVVIRLAEVAARGMNSIFRAVSKYAMPPQTGTFSYLNDYSHLMAAKDDAKSLATKMTKGHAVDSFFVKHSELVPLPLLGALYPDSKPYTNEGEFKRVDSVLIDTTRYPVGTIVSNIKRNGRPFLKVEQPDGITVYRDTEQQMAIVPSPGRAVSGAYLDHSFIRRFEALGDHPVLAIKYNRKEGLTSKGFESIEEAVKSPFYARDIATIQDVKRNIVDIDQNGRHKSFTVKDVVYRGVEPQPNKGFLKKATTLVFGDAINAVDLPDISTPIKCFNNVACGPIWPKRQPHPYRPNPNEEHARMEIARQSWLKAQF